MEANSDISQITILTDEEEPNPSKEFHSLGNTICSLIKDSSPRFTLGIYGDWGTGKSTLMKLIENKLKTEEEIENPKILKVWFNAWKFEREEHFAAIALLKTILYQMEGQSKFDSLSNAIRKSLKVLGKDFYRKIATETIINEKGVDEAEKNLNRNLKFLEKIGELDNDTIYFNGLEAVRSNIEEIRKKDPGFRIVIFVDDLDRCSPQMALEVLESIKVFLDIEGFIYVLGISHTTIFNLINQAYKEIGIDGVEYIKKIIQIPIKLPIWTAKDAKIILGEKMVPKLSSKYQKIFSEDNTQTVITELEQNPRKIKRLINNLIIAYETFSLKQSDHELDIKALFLFQILKKHWPSIFQEYMKPSSNFEDLIIDCGDILRSNLFMDYKDTLSINSPEEIEQSKKRWEVSIKRDPPRSNPQHVLDLDYRGIEFIEKYGDQLNKIKDWELYRLATDIVIEVDINGISKNTLLAEKSMEGKSIS